MMTSSICPFRTRAGHHVALHTCLRSLQELLVSLNGVFEKLVILRFATGKASRRRFQKIRVLVSGNLRHMPDGARVAAPTATTKLKT